MKSNELPCAIAELVPHLQARMGGILNRVNLIRGKSSIGIVDFFRIEDCASLCTDDDAQALIVEHFRDNGWRIAVEPKTIIGHWAFTTEGGGETYLVAGEVQGKKTLEVCVILYKPEEIPIT